MSSSATTTAIPLTNISQQQTANNATLLGVNSNAPTTSLTRPSPSSAQQVTTTNNTNGSSSVNNTLATSIATTNNASQAQVLPRYASRPPTWSEKFANSLSLANGIGTMALIAAFIFGIGAWVGMKIQINQGGRSMELAIWTACADHQVIQNSSLCQSIMAKDFSSEFTKREVLVESQAMVVVLKRDHGSDAVSDLSQQNPPAIPSTPLSNLLSSLSASDRSLVEGQTQDYSYNHYDQADPAIRATIFPFVHLLTYPLHWIFDFIESLLLLTVYCLHKVLSWMTWIFIFTLQAVLYSWVERLVKTVLASLDTAIWEVMPSWMPAVLASNLASLFGLTALRSFWYGTNFLTSLKWIFIFRVGMLVVIEAAKAGYGLWVNWNSIVEERRRMQSQAPVQVDSVDGARRRYSWLDSSRVS